MMQRWMEAGGDAATFWRLSPRAVLNIVLRKKKDAEPVRQALRRIPRP